MAQHSDAFIRLANDARQRIREVTPTEAREMLSAGAVLLDVRDRDEFVAGHIDGATHLSRGTLEMRVHEVIPDTDTPVVCYCAGGNRGALAADTLQKLGYRNVVSIAGGRQAYLKDAGEK